MRSGMEPSDVEEKVVRSRSRFVTIERGHNIKYRHCFDLTLTTEFADFPNYDVSALAEAVCRESGWTRLSQGIRAMMWAHGEADSLRSQFVTTKGRGGRRTPPWAFTEHAAIAANLRELGYGG